MPHHLLRSIRNKLRAVFGKPPIEQKQMSNDQEQTKSADSESLSPDNLSGDDLEKLYGDEWFADALLRGLDEAVRAKRLRESKPESSQNQPDDPPR